MDLLSRSDSKTCSGPDLVSIVHSDNLVDLDSDELEVSLRRDNWSDLNSTIFNDSWWNSTTSRADTTTLHYLDLSGNALSGSISDVICMQKNLTALALSKQRLSGTIPYCFGKRFTSLNTLVLAENYLTGYIPQNFNTLTSLQTLILASNRLRCDAPGIDGAVSLGEGRFQGIWYPANVDLSKYLESSAAVLPWTDRLKSLIPDAANVVLLYTGNSMLTTHASLIDHDEAPRSLKTDAIRRGL